MSREAVTPRSCGFAAAHFHCIRDPLDLSLKCLSVFPAYPGNPWGVPLSQFAHSLTHTAAALRRPPADFPGNLSFCHSDPKRAPSCVGVLSVSTPFDVVWPISSVVPRRDHFPQTQPNFCGTLQTPSRAFGIPPIVHHFRPRRCTSFGSFFSETVYLCWGLFLVEYFDNHIDPPPPRP